MQLEIKTTSLTWDEFIYPRATKNDKTIRAYIESLAIGAQFPPIKIQEVFNYSYGDGTYCATVILDGIHRWFAFKESGKDTIPAVAWQDSPLDYEKSRAALLLEAAECNIGHGDRLSSGDKKRIARDIASTDPECEWTEQALAAKLGVTRQSVNNWISDIRARQRASRNTAILKLSRLGWSKPEISKTTGISPSRASEIVGKANFGNFDDLLSQGHDMAYIAAHHNMDLALAWALRLEGKTDQEKFQELDWGLRTWDQWNFNDCDERFGDEWPGRIPAQLVAHTLFFYSEPGDLVLDPMAGGGVVSDVCTLFERKCIAFDMVARDNRPEIRPHYWEPANGHWPMTKKPDLIFFDPPYFSKKKKEYREKAGKKTPSISSFTKPEYEKFFEDFFRLAHRHSKPTTTMAFLNADWLDFQSTPASEERPDNAITVFDYHRLLSKTGWTVIRRIECPLSTERLSGNNVQKMQDKRILGTISRTLLIAKRS